MTDRAIPTVVQWGRFFAAKTDEELEQVAMDHPDLMQVKEALDRVSAEPATRQLAREREEGLHEIGKTERKAEGKSEGKAETMVLLLLLLLKFGPLDDSVKSRVESATEAEVDRWFERIVHASTLDDVFTE